MLRLITNQRKLDNKSKNRPYRISEYDPNWPAQFEEIRDSLLPVFTDDLIKVEHIGSTSVPGLSAKPVIDILVTLSKKDSFAVITEKMRGLGYELEKDYIESNSITFWKTNTEGEKVENVHVCISNSFKSKQLSQVSKYLRQYPDKAKEYQELKSRLNKEFPDDYIKYREGKRIFLEDLEKLALDN